MICRLLSTLAQASINFGFWLEREVPNLDRPGKRRLVDVVGALTIVLACMALASCLTGCGLFAGGGLPVTTIRPAEALSEDSIRREHPSASNKAETSIEVTPASSSQPAAPGTPPVEIELGNGKRITAPPGAAVKFSTTEAVAKNDGLYTHDRRATGQGAGLSTKEKGLVGSFNASSPGATLGKSKESGGGFADGGDSSFEWTSLISGLSTLATWLGGIGITFLVGAAVIGYLTKSLVNGLSLAGIGLLFLGTAVIVDKYPWVLALTAFAVILAGGLWFAWRRGWLTNVALTGAVASSSPATQAEIKSRMAVKAEREPFLKTVISKAKAASGVVPDPVPVVPLISPLVPPLVSLSPTPPAAASPSPTTASPTGTSTAGGG